MSTATAAPDAPTAPAAEKGRSKLMLGIAVLIVAGVVGGAWFVFLAPAQSSGAKPGEVLPLESMQINLAEGHYLRLGLSLQLTTTAEAELEGSKANDAAITVFSGRPVTEVNKPAAREKLRHQLVRLLEERYEGGVMDVYFTEYVTQ